MVLKAGLTDLPQQGEERVSGVGGWGVVVLHGEGVPCPLLGWCCGVRWQMILGSELSFSISLSLSLSLSLILSLSPLLVSVESVRLSPVWRILIVKCEPMCTCIAPPLLQESRFSFLEGSGSAVAHFHRIRGAHPVMGHCFCSAGTSPLTERERERERGAKIQLITIMGVVFQPTHCLCRQQYLEGVRLSLHKVWANIELSVSAVVHDGIGLQFIQRLRKPHKVTNTELCLCLLCHSQIQGLPRPHKGCFVR